MCENSKSYQKTLKSLKKVKFGNAKKKLLQHKWPGYYSGPNNFLRKLTFVKLVFGILR